MIAIKVDQIQNNLCALIAHVGRVHVEGRVRVEGRVHVEQKVRVGQRVHVMKGLLPRVNYVKKR
jgi:hypothetical protein